MKLIVGLGNPGRKYEETRHNAGWLWLDQHFGADDYEFNKYGYYDYKVVDRVGGQYILIKPQQFMNNSGGPVKFALEHYQLTPSDLIVVHDEFDLAVGDHRYEFDRGSAGHNGVQSVSQVLGTTEYWRLRIGVRPLGAPAGLKADQVVLGKLGKDEQEKIKDIPIPF